jgi:hypothetical protein
MQESGSAQVPSEGSANTARDRAATEMAREIYWARPGDQRPPGAPDAIRGKLEDLAHRMRVDHRRFVPVDEPLLGSSSAMKHKVKAGVWRVTRFSTMRYDRLLGELAELSAELAARLASTEAEVARLREELSRRREEP